MMKKHFLCSLLLALLCGNAFAAAPLNLPKGRWLFVTKAVDGPSANDFDFLAAVVASSTLTEGEPSVLAVTHATSLVDDIWHKDYIRRYKYSRAIVVGQNITSIPGVFPVTTLNSATAGVEQAKEIARTVWQSSDGVVVCSANDYANALVAASLAARLKVPLLFSATTGDLTGTVSDGVNPPVPVTLKISVGPAPPRDITPPSPNSMKCKLAPSLGDIYNPFFPALRSGHRVFQRPSSQKQIPINPQLFAMGSSMISAHAGRCRPKPSLLSEFTL